MPPKKKKKVVDEDDSTEKINRIYRKKCEATEVTVYKKFKTKVEEALDDNDHLKEFVGIDMIGPQGCINICETLMELKYRHLKELKLYKCGISDDGCKAIADYMKIGKCVKILVLPNNEITAKGCEYLGDALGPNNNLPLIKLKLDFNEIGVEGLKNLAMRLNANGTLERLSLNYCNLDSKAAVFLQDILGFCDTQLWSLKLKGNYLRNEGVYQLFRALEANTILNKLVLSNNQFGESEDIPVIQKICEILTSNTTCYYYDFTQNAIYDKGAKEILECVKLYKTVWRMELPDIMAKEIKDEFKKVLKKRKKPKKKKKKKGKGKKKKKK